MVAKLLSFLFMIKVESKKNLKLFGLLKTVILVFIGLNLQLGTFFVTKAQASLLCIQLFQNQNAKNIVSEIVDLDSRVQDWIHERQINLNPKLPRRKNQIIKLNNHTYPVVALLGGGVEGQIYLVKKDLELAVIKIFSDKDDGSQGNFDKIQSEMLFNLKWMERLAQDYNVPSILDVDLTQNRVLLEFVEGVSIKEIERNPKILSLSSQEALEILNMYRNSKYFKGALPQNIIYSFKTKQFYIIDPF